MPRIFKRGDVWFTWVPKPGGGTRRVSTQCTDKKAAEYRAGELEREAASPGHAAASQATTQDAVDGFVGSRATRKRADATLEYYEKKLGHAVRLLPARLADVDGPALERYMAKRRSEGAGNTLKKEIGAIGSMLRHAKRMNQYVLDLETVLPELEDGYEPRERFLLPLELVALIGALPIERAAHVAFIVATGARWGESLRARREDVIGEMVRIRGTKTKKAAGVVPVPPPMRSMLEWALANSRNDGPTGPLFATWGNVNRDLPAACGQVGIAPVSPNDLRRTFGSWMRIAGISTDLIGSMMRHTDSRMAERVYGRLRPADMNALVSAQMPAILVTGGLSETMSSRGLLMGCDPAKTGHTGGTRETPVLHETPCFPVPGDGIEPPTRGFSILRDAQYSAANAGDSGPSRAANGLSFRARARRWLMKEAA